MSTEDPAGPIEAARMLRARLLSDPHRPTYHFVTPEGVCMPFDPNGALCWQGRYHLCYIFQDERGHCWGHASSADLLHWRHHPTALAPNPGDPDRGIFSGNAFINKQGEATILYHGVSAGNCIATSAEPSLDHWTKLPTNPIVPIPKEGEPDFGKYSSWDPHGWLEGDTYYAIFGGSQVTLFRSTDMVQWEFVGPLLSHDMPDVDPDEDISCPDLFTLGDRQMLLCISHKRGCRYYLGRFRDKRFHPEAHARMNWPGGTCFAPESLIDERGRRIMWAWVLDRRTEAQIQESGWSGTMTLPRVLSLDGDTLCIEPVEELERLRTNPREVGLLRIPAGSEIPLEQVEGDVLEIVAEMEGEAGSEFGLKLRCSPDGAEQTSIGYDPARSCVRIDVSQASLDSEISYRTFCMHGRDDPLVTYQEAPLHLRANERFRLRVFLDRSILEVFANGRQCLTQRIYPTREDSLGVYFFARGGSAWLHSATAWDMIPTNPY